MSNGNDIKLNNFDFLRLAAASFVLVSHMYAHLGLAEPKVVGGHSLGNLGVLIFFSISGFLVTSSWVRDPSVLRFAMRRALRICPAFIVVILVGAFLVTPWVSVKSTAELFSSGEMARYLSNVLLIRPYFELQVFPQSNVFSGLNGSLWTIPYEVWCYAALAGAGVLFRNFLRLALPVLLAFVCVYFIVVMGGQGWLNSTPERPSWFYWAYFGTFFLVGAVVRLHYQIMSAKAVLIGLLFISALLFSFGHNLLGLLACVPILAIRAGNASWSVLRRAGMFGDFSYGYYLYGWLSQQVVIYALGREHSFSLLLSASAVMTLTCAVVSWYLVEKPALSYKPAGARTKSEKSFVSAL